MLLFLTLYPASRARFTKGIMYIELTEKSPTHNLSYFGLQSLHVPSIPHGPGPRWWSSMGLWTWVNCSTCSNFRCLPFFESMEWDSHHFAVSLTRIMTFSGAFDKLFHHDFFSSDSEKLLRFLFLGERRVVHLVLKMNLMLILLPWFIEKSQLCDSGGLEWVGKSHIVFPHIIPMFE